MTYNQTRTTPKPIQAVNSYLQNQTGRWSVVLLITLLALALRMFKIGEWSFWIDEMFTLRDSVELEKNQLTFLLTRWFVNGFGRSELALRAPSLIIGTVTIPILYGMLGRITTGWHTLLVITLLAISRWHIFWSQNARFYASILLFYTLALICLYLGTTSAKSRTQWLILCVLCLVIAVSDRILALFFVPVALTYIAGLLWLKHRETEIRWRKEWLWMGLLGIVCVGVMAWALRFQISTFFAWFVGNPNYNPVRISLELVTSMGIPLVIAAVISTPFALRERTPFALIVVVSAWIPMILIVMMSLVARVEPRYVFMAFPSWILLATFLIRTISISSIDKTAMLPWLILLGILIAEPLVQDVLYYAYQNGYRPNWRTPLTDIHRDAGVNDRLLTRNVELAHYYTPDTDNFIFGDEIDWEVVQSPRPAVWLVEAPIPFPPAWRDWAIENCQIVQVHDVDLVGRTYVMRTHYCPTADLRE